MTNPTSVPSSNRSIMIVLSYLWLLALVPLLVEKQDAEVQWHAKHGLVLTGAEVVLWIAITIVTMILSMIAAPLGCLFSLLHLGLWLGIVVLHIVLIVKGVNGQPHAARDQRVREQVLRTCALAVADVGNREPVRAAGVLRDAGGPIRHARRNQTVSSARIARDAAGRHPVPLHADVQPVCGARG